MSFDMIFTQLLENLKEVDLHIACLALEDVLKEKRIK